MTTNSTQQAYNVLIAHATENLSTAQLKILKSVNFLEPRLDVVAAGAGAGKTRCLSYIVNRALLSEKINNVYILTSTRTAKDEAFARVSSLYDELEFYQYGTRRIIPSFVKTIHAFGLRALSCVNESGSECVAKVIHKSEICDFIKTELETIKEKQEFKFERDDICAGLAQKDAIEMIYNVRSERLKQLMTVDDDSLGKLSKLVLQGLKTKMLTNDMSYGTRLVDFDEIIRELADSNKPIINDGDLLVVDEAQDLNRCQMKVVLNCLRAGNRNVLILGDDSQGIFQFSGAVNNTIKTIINKCEASDIKFSRYGLFQNHRSTNQIVQASEMLLPMSDRESRLGVRGNGNGADVQVCIASNPDSEAKRVAERAIKLVFDGVCQPHEIVFLRHTNWSFSDPLVGAVKTESKRNGISFPFCIIGAPMNTTISMKALSIIQVGIGSERFVSQNDSSGHDLLKVFSKSVRCGKGTPALTIKAFSKAWEMFGFGDIATLFTKRQHELLECFRVLLKEEENGQTSSCKKQKTTPGSEAIVSVKEKNFIESVRVLGKACKLVKQRLGDAVNNRVPMNYAVLDSPVPIDGRPSEIQMKKSPPKSAHPQQLKSNLGGVAWIIVRDLVDYPFERPVVNDGQESLKMVTEREEIHSLIDALDVAIPTESKFGNLDMDIVADAWDGPISKQLGVLLDKETADKAKFSTIHKYKGKESNVAFVTALKEPFVKIDACRRAAMGQFHIQSCNNKNGRNSCRCVNFEKQLGEVSEGIRSERQRLHYVASSRAKERLFLSTSESNFPISVLVENGVGSNGQWEKM